jgi:nucleoside-diphosphate-sugar epimerase
LHTPCRPGEGIDERQPVDPRWVYPKSKAAAEVVIRVDHKAIPYVILRLAGVYDERSMVPTTALQMAHLRARLQSNSTLAAL